MQLKKVKIEGLNNNKEKNTCGLMIKDKNGQDQWINGWSDVRTKALNKGEEIYLWLYQEEYNGKQYWKFRLPSLDHLLATAGKEVTLQEAAKAVGGTIVEGDPDFVDVSQIPF